MNFSCIKITDTKYELLNDVVDYPFAELNFNGLLGEFTLETVVSEISLAQVTFAMSKIKELNYDLTL